MANPRILDGNAMLRWVELALPEPPWPGGAAFVGFVYQDWQAGMSAKGGPADDATVATTPRLTVRLPIGVDGRILDDAEVAARGLPARPPWLDAYGVQPPADGPWRRDPLLAGKLHRQYPDDLQVLVHDGEPKRTGRRTEACWVRLDAVEDGPPRPSLTATGAALGRGTRLYAGVLLSPPKQLTTYAAGARVRLIPDPGGPHPIAVTAAYLDERAGWTVHACTGCGLSEGLEPPSLMFRSRFPEVGPDAEPVGFTAFCPVCGPSGSRTFERRGAPIKET